MTVCWEVIEAARLSHFYPSSGARPGMCKRCALLSSCTFSSQSHGDTPSEDRVSSVFWAANQMLKPLRQIISRCCATSPVCVHFQGSPQLQLDTPNWLLQLLESVYIRTLSGICPCPSHSLPPTLLTGLGYWDCGVGWGSVQCINIIRLDLCDRVY